MGGNRKCDETKNRCYGVLIPHNTPYVVICYVGIFWLDLQMVGQIDFPHWGGRGSEAG